MPQKESRLFNYSVHLSRTRQREISDLKTRNVTGLSVNTTRALTMDATQKSNSGHLGAPMAPAYTVYTKFLRRNPEDPLWPDRFILSGGHASMLRYALCISPATTSTWRT